MADGPSVAPWAAWLGVVGVVAAGVSGLAIADRPPVTTLGLPVEAFLLEDGAATLVEQSDGAIEVVEATRSIGPQLLLGAPTIPANAIFSALGDEGEAALDTAHFYRLTRSDVRGELAQLTELYRIDGSGLRLLAVTGRDTGFVFEPGLLSLPADPVAGATWAEEGTALPADLLRYRSSGSIADGDAGCIEVTQHLELVDPSNGEVILESDDRSTWCPGEGAVESTWDGGASRSTSRALVNGAVTADPGAASAAPPSWRDASSWSPRPVEFVAQDPMFGANDGLQPIAADGVTTASGVTAFIVGVDLEAWAPAGGAVERAWTAHPGGEIIELAAVGDIIVAATSRRGLVAYDERGVRLWRTEFADVVTGITPDGDGALVVVALDGEVRRVDAATGEALWSHALGADATAAASVTGDVVLAADRDGTLHALSLADGDERWTVELGAPTLLDAAGERLVAALEDGTLVALDLAEEGATKAWSADTSGPYYGLAVLEHRTVVLSAEGAFLLDDTGRTTMSFLGDDVDLEARGDIAVVLGPAAAIVLDARDSAVSRIALDPVASDIARALVPRPDGVWITASDHSATALEPR